MNRLDVCDAALKVNGSPRGNLLMAKRMFVMLGAVAAFLAVIGTVKFRQIQTAVAQASSFQPPPEAVTTTVARQEPWPATLGAIGTVAAARGVTVSADLPGIV